MRIRVFVDYWNFQLSLNQKDAGGRFKVDWRGLGPWLAKKAAEVVGCPGYTFDGVIIYASFNQNTEEGRKFNHWATTWLDRQAGISVKCLPRRPKSLPKCPNCHREIVNCPHCNKAIAATVEKGVDTLIATDLIRLAWENAYEVAVIASSDSDLVPAVQFLEQKGIKVVQAGFPPIGVDLATSCWGSFDVGKLKAEINRS
jgi:uncharacterized LabA/DUF88 family protein